MIENMADVVDEKRVYTTNKDWTFSTILEMYNDGDINPQPSYQREYIMDDKKASKLVESILLQIPIPTIYLCEENDNTLSVIDGQQRITSITRYMTNDFKLLGLEELTSLNGKFFKDLEKSHQRLIKQSSVNCIVITKKSQDLKYEIFARLNQGSTKLKPQELRNCIYRGSLNDLLEHLACENKNLPILFHADNNRKQYQEHILRFFALRERNNYASSLKKTMNKFMQSNQNISDSEIEKYKNLFNRTIDIIVQIFGEKAFCSYDRQNKKITNTFSGSIYDSLIVACSFYDNHTLMINADKLRNEFENLKKNDIEYQDCTYAATGSKIRVENRIRIVDALISSIVNKKSVRRCFSEEEKLQLWETGPHICSYCNQQILDINDAEVDHIIPYSKGGETILDNAQLLHRHCNRVKNNILDENGITFEEEEL